MTNAFEITPEDVVNVMRKHGKNISEAEAEVLFSALDLGEIESAALYGDDLDEQTALAYDEIARQLML